MKENPLERTYRNRGTDIENKTEGSEGQALKFLTRRSRIPRNEQSKNEETVFHIEGNSHRIF